MELFDSLENSCKNLQHFLTLTRSLNLNCHLTSLFPVIGKQQVQLGKKGRFTTTYMQCHLCVRGKLSVSPNSWLLAGAAHSASIKDPEHFLSYFVADLSVISKIWHQSNLKNLIILCKLELGILNFPEFFHIIHFAFLKKLSSQEALQILAGFRSFECAKIQQFLTSSPQFCE